LDVGTLVLFAPCWSTKKQNSLLCKCMLNEWCDWNVSSHPGHAARNRLQTLRSMTSDRLPVQWLNDVFSKNQQTPNRSDLRNLCWSAASVHGEKLEWFTVSRQC
jgi:hypothetical protein